MVRDPVGVGPSEYLVRQDGRASTAGVLTRSSLHHDSDEKRTNEISGDRTDCPGGQG